MQQNFKSSDRLPHSCFASSLEYGLWHLQLRNASFFMSQTSYIQSCFQLQDYYCCQTLSLNSLFQVLKVLKQGFELGTLGFAKKFHCANQLYHLSYSASYDHAQLCLHEKNKIFPFGFVSQIFLSLKLHVMLKVLVTKSRF